jgi:hypothetical protein
MRSRFESVREGRDNASHQVGYLAASGGNARQLREHLRSTDEHGGGANVVAADSDGVVAIADGDVLVRAADDTVSAVAERNIVTESADDGIVAIAGLDGVVAGAGINDVVPSAEDNRLPGLKRNMRRHDASHRERFRANLHRKLGSWLIQVLAGKIHLERGIAFA